MKTSEQASMALLLIIAFLRVFGLLEAEHVFTLLEHIAKDIFILGIAGMVCEVLLRGFGKDR
ncbi:hypothetical protein K7W42_22195 [Deinococcus sp. HMF7604]|uniref:hypothetical protein n=1 Tax=Deinococcus betulae TaxID=2873312 RepID=UPI001CCD27E1|nr:hypothetical protein [Deinococcus betulae]MBZ9753547.1 hypothetical protein [Deinococcus betulae]